MNRLYLTESQVKLLAEAVRIARASKNDTFFRGSVSDEERDQLIDDMNDLDDILDILEILEEECE